MRRGWIAAHRQLFDPSHDLWDGRQVCRPFAWLDLISLARWEGGAGLDRGQLSYAQSYLAHRWRWDRKTVARFLDDLEQKGRITRVRRTRHKPDVISICNYDTYQDTRPAKRSSYGAAKGASKGAANAPQVEQEQEEEQLPTTSLWGIWIDEVWGGETDRRLTDKRRKKLEMVWKEHLQDRDEPEQFFRLMARAMLADEWWGDKHDTHVPETALRNQERRERWAVQAKKNGGRVPERDKGHYIPRAR